MINLLLHLTSEKGLKFREGCNCPAVLCSVSVMAANIVIARYKSINRNGAADVRFSGKFWFLVPNSKGCKCPFCRLSDAHDKLLFLFCLNIA